MAVFTSLLFTVLVFYSLSLQGNYWIFFVVYFLTAMTGIVLVYPCFHVCLAYFLDQPKMG